MSNNALIIEERSRDIGDFLVGRLLPFRKKRMVGPFIFIDHMGPTEVKPGKYLEIGPHPHIGLSTLTFLLEGEIVHRDSLGTEQRISPGAVNWMTAGSGIVHSERSPDDLKNQGNKHTVHGYQIWVALPREKEEIAPSFHHIPASDLPQWTENSMQCKLIAGELNGHTSPVPVHSELYMLEMKSTEPSVWRPEHLFGEFGICIVSGNIETCGTTISEGNLLVAKPEHPCHMKLASHTHVLVFGGTPLEEDRHIWWNFVSSSKDRIEQAKADWNNQRFPKIDGEHGYIPLPGN